MILSYSWCTGCLQLLGVVDEGHDGVHQVQGSRDDTERSQGESHLSLGSHELEVMIGNVSVPVVQGGSSDSDPHESAHDVHDRVTQLPEMTRRSVSKSASVDKFNESFTVYGLWFRIRR